MAQPGAEQTTARALFDRLLVVSREAHQQGLHEVAYHALTAALHAAQSGGDMPGVETIAEEAREQIEWIDGHAPAHRLSTESAKRHDHPGVYAMLGRQADMIARMLARESAVESRE